MQVFNDFYYFTYQKIICIMKTVAMAARGKQLKSEIRAL